jgi:hypothetical protein
MNRTVVAAGSFSAVERCDCGAVYLTVGPMSLKLDPRALSELRSTLDRAVRVLGVDATNVSACPGEAMSEDGEGGMARARRGSN